MSGRALGRGWASARDNWHGQRPASAASEHGGRRDGRAWSTRCERERPRGRERGDDGSETRRGTDGGAVTAGSSVPQASEDEDGDRAGARAEEGRRRGPHVRGEKGTTRPGEAVEEEDEDRATKAVRRGGGRRGVAPAMCDVGGVLGHEQIRRGG